jgi:hypothetical protein
MEVLETSDNLASLIYTDERTQIQEDTIDDLLFNAFSNTIFKLVDIGRVDVRDVFQQSAERYTRIEIVQTLLKDPRVDLSANGNSALLSATHLGYEELFDLLFNDPRVVLTQTQLSVALLLALEMENVRMLYMLLSLKEADPNPVVVTAIITRRYHIVNELIRDKRIHLYVFTLRDTL